LFAASQGLMLVRYNPPNKPLPSTIRAGFLIQADLPAKDAGDSAYIFLDEKAINLV